MGVGPIKKSCMAAGLALVCHAGVYAQTPRMLQFCAGDATRSAVSFRPVQDLIRQAVEKQGGAVQFSMVPWRRCLEGVRAQTYDGAVGAGDVPAFHDFLSFPQKDGQTNPLQGLSNVHYVAVRAVGSTAGWDGRQFLNLKTAVLFASGNAATRDVLQKLQVAASDPSGKPTTLLHMLLKERNETAVLREADADTLLETAEFCGKLEKLLPEVYSVNAYLGIQQQRYMADPAFFNAVWDEIGRLRTMPVAGKATRRH